MQGNIHSRIIFAPFALVSVGELTTGRIQMSYISLNTAFLGEFKMGRNRLQLKKGENNMGRK